MVRTLSEEDVKSMDVTTKPVERRSGEDRRKVHTMVDPEHERRKNNRRRR